MDKANMKSLALEREIVTLRREMNELRFDCNFLEDEVVLN